MIGARSALQYERYYDWVEREVRCKRKPGGDQSCEVLWTGRIDGRCGVCVAPCVLGVACLGQRRVASEPTPSPLGLLPPCLLSPRLLVA